MKFVNNLLGAIVGLAMMSVGAAAEVSPTAVDGATTVSVDEAVELFDQGAVFVDVRKASDVDAGTVPGAVHLDVNTGLTAESLAEVAGTSDPVVFFCNGVSCLRSSDACVMAVEWGYTTVYYLRDGYPAWEAAGYPVQ